MNYKAMERSARLVDQIKILALARHTSGQIGEKLGISFGHVLRLANENGIKIATDQQLYAEQFPSLKKQIRSRRGVRSDPSFSHEELLKKVRYDLADGEFYWLSACRLKSIIGKKAGYLNVGNLGKTYRQINIFGNKVLAHRLAWFYVYGKWPNGTVDHVDNDGLNNRIGNLRECTQQQNTRNVERKGYTFSKRDQRFVAQIMISGKHLRLGSFPTAELARQAYLNAAKKYFGDFFVGNRAVAAGASS